MIPFDYHTHHVRCGHAVGTMREYIEEAVHQKMGEFGVSDHAPAYWFDGIDHALPRTQMAVSELPACVAEAKALQEEYADRIALRVGIEADFIEGREADLERLLAPHDFDYVLGSVHYTLGVSVFDWTGRGEQTSEAVFREYYRQVAAAAHSGLFDILSHLSVIECYSPPIPDALARELYPQVAEAVAASGCAVEINTSGYRKMGGDEPFPNRLLLRELIQRGVPLTFGSDAHEPRIVGYDSERVEALLNTLGVDTTESVLIQRKRRSFRAFRTR